MMRGARRRRPRRWGGGAVAAAFVGAGLAALGCESQHKAAVTHFGELICRTASDSAVIATAVRGYIDQLDLEPRRFLYLPGTDSSPPEPAIQVLQNVGPTYVFSADPKLQAPLRKMLETVGDYPTLLLSYHGFTRADPLHPLVTLSGHYVTGSDDGKSTGRQTIALQCDSIGWHVPAAKGSPAADAAADTSAH
jgi:hypothetical protein